jgi:hypothetical protein
VAPGDGGYMGADPCVWRPLRSVPASILVSDCTSGQSTNPPRINGTSQSGIPSTWNTIAWHDGLNEFLTIRDRYCSATIRSLGDRRPTPKRIVDAGHAIFYRYNVILLMRKKAITRPPPKGIAAVPNAIGVPPTSLSCSPRTTSRIELTMI